MDRDTEDDSTLVFEKEVLDAVSKKISPSVVAVLIKPTGTGFIVKATNTHNLVVVETSLLGYNQGRNKITVRYFDGMIGTVDHIKDLPGCNISILYSPNLGKRRPEVEFAEIEDKECQRIVTLFPYKNGMMLFKGNITLTDCTCESMSGLTVPGSANSFMFTCPMSACYEIYYGEKRVERATFLRKVIGAAVFDLQGRALGRIWGLGGAHMIKYATKYSVFRTHLDSPALLDWQETEEKEKKRKVNDLSSSNEEIEPVPVVKKAKKEKKAKKKKCKIEAEEDVNGDGKLTTRSEDDPADPNALSNFGISDVLKEKLKSKGVNTLLPFQATTFNCVLDGNDLVCHACTGHDKTLAFVLPILESLVNGPHKASRRTNYGRHPSVLVLLPTRELADQVHAEIKFYGEAFGLSTCSVYGGSSSGPQEIAMKEGVDIVVGTPGRIKNFIDKGTLNLKSLKFHVLDEADKMHKLGLAKDIEVILGEVEDVTGVQTLLFSTTVSEWVQKISMKYLKGEKKTTLELVGNKKMKASAAVQHIAIPCIRAAWAEIIAPIIRCYSHGGQTIIFTERKESARELSDLIPDSHALDGHSTHAQRKVVSGFRSSTFSVLVATNEAARGLDINDVQLIIQCEPPHDVEAYIERSGPTRNAGAAVMLFEPTDKFSLARIESESGVKFEHVSDVVKYTGNKAADAIASVSDRVIPVFRQRAEELLSSPGMSAVDLLAKALAKEVGYTLREKRSLLSLVENYTTLHLKTGRPMRAPRDALSILERFMPRSQLSDVHGIELTADETGAVFDVPSGEAEYFIQGAENAAGVTLDEAKQLPALQKNREQSRGNSGGSRFGNEAADIITSVPDSVIPVFLLQAEDLLRSGRMSPVDLLAKALAKAVGYTDIKKKSLLSSMRNCTTSHLTTVSTMHIPWHVLSTSKSFMPEDRLSNVQAVALTADGRRTVFDVPSAEVQDYLKGADNVAGVTLHETKELPALQEKEQQARGGRSRHGRGGRSGGRGFGGGGGGRGRFGGRGR